MQPVQYVIVRPKEAVPRRVSLPLVIGYGGDADVVVNAEALPRHAYCVHAREGRLAVRQLATGAELDVTALRTLGLDLRGPVRGAPDDAASIARWAREALALEAQWFASLAEGTRRALGGRLGQKARLGAWAAVAASLALAMGTALVAEDERPDLSRVPRPLAFNAVYDGVVGSTPSTGRLGYGYERGVTFAVSAPPGVEASATLFEFKAAGLDFGGELTVAVNGAVVLETEVDLACRESFCEQSVRLAPGAVVPGENLIHFAHADVASAYVLTDLVLRPLPRLKPVEAEKAKLLLGLATQAYEEREVLPDGLATAKSNLRDAVAILARRIGGEAELAKARALEEAVDKALAARTAELWAEVEAAVRFDKKLEAKDALRLILRLHPDPASAVAIEARARLDEMGG